MKQKMNVRIDNQEEVFYEVLRHLGLDYNKIDVDLSNDIFDRCQDIMDLVDTFVYEVVEEFN